MTAEDFKNETFGYPAFGEAGFEGGERYCKKLKNVHYRTAEIKSAFNYHLTRGTANSQGFNAKAKNKNIFINLWLKAENLKEFKNLVLAAPEAKKHRFAVYLFEDDKRIYKLLFGEYIDCFRTMSDAGSVKIGVGSFTQLIGTGGGDGLSKVVVIDHKEEVCLRGFGYYTQIEGKFDIYDYDCGEDVARTLEGGFNVWHGEGLVIFEKLS